MRTLKYLIVVTALSIGHTLALEERSKRQTTTVSFGQPSYSFSPGTCKPGVIAGTASATGATYYTIDNPNQYIGVDSRNGQILLINYFTTNIPQTATIKAYVGPGFTGTSSSTQVTVTCSAAATAAGGSASGTTMSSGNGIGATTLFPGQIVSGTGSGSTATGLPVASQVPYVISAAACALGGTVGTVSVTNPAQVVFGSATSGTAFLVSSSGVITLSRAIIAGTYTVQVTATNPYGTTTIPVTINAGCTGSSGTSGTGTGTGGTTVPQFAQTSYTFNPTGTTCVAGATVGTVTVTSTSGSPSYTIQPTSTMFTVSSSGVITLTGSPLPTTGSTNTFSVVASNNIGTALVPVTVLAGTCTGGSSSGGAATGGFQFAQPTFTMSSTSCTPGATIGAFTANGAPGIVAYSIDQPTLGYVISQQGVVTAPVGATAGTFTVRAFSNGQTTTTAVTVSTTACVNGGSGTGSGTTGGIIFNQPSYSYTFASGCTAFGVIGQVAATTTPSTTGPVTFSLPVNPQNNFGIDPNSGMIYATVSNGQCNILQVTAKNVIGQTATDYVYIDCTTGGTGGVNCANGNGAPATSGPCVPGAFGCGDIG